MDGLLIFAVFFPAVAAAVIMIIVPAERQSEAKWLALAATLMTFGCAIAMAVAFDRNPGEIQANPFQFESQGTWIDAGTAGFDVQFHMGVDGLGLTMVVLTAFLFVIATLISFGVEVRSKEYFFWLLALETGVLGVFTSLDLLMFFVFWEVELLPMYMLISVWGTGRKEYSAIKFVLYTIAGSALMLAGFLVMGFSAEPSATFDMVALQGSEISNVLLPLWAIFGPIFVAFAIKLPMFPLHTWLPDAHTDAPTAVSVILAGVLLKMGGYGILRILVTLMPETAEDYGVWMASLAAISIIYGAVITIRQTDLKRLVAYSSVSHMGYVLLGIAALGHVSMNGAALQMFTHGTITGLLFLMVGVIYDRTHTRDIDQLSGLAHTMPLTATVMIIAGLASLGLPALSGFVAELMVFLGSFDKYTVPTIFAVLGILLSAGYITWMVQRVFFGERNERWAHLPDADHWWERVPMVALVIVIVAVGVYPAFIVDVIDTGMLNIVDRVVGLMFPVLVTDHLNSGGGLGADLDRLGPVFVVMLTAALIIVADLVIPRDKVKWLAAVAIVGLGVSAAWLVQLIVRDRWASFFSDTMAFDDFSVFFSFFFLAVCAAVVIASLDYLERFGKHKAEFLALTLIATAGMMLLAGSRDLVAIFVALELTAITQFILAGFLRDDRGSEAAIKYLLIGAISSAVILYGMAFLYGIAGTTRLITTDGAPSIADAIANSDGGTRSALLVSMVFLAAGFGYKMATVPFQMWTPDVYQGSPTPVAAFLSVGSKAAAFAVVLRIFFEGFGVGDVLVDDWEILFAVLAAVSMVVGNVMAVRQSNIRRMLGYSSIAQAGNFLVGVAAISATSDGEAIGASGVVFFIATYAFTNLGAFFAIMAISNRTGSDEIADYGGMGRRAPVPAAVLAFCLLSLTGLPPTAGFWAKLYVFNAGVQADLIWLVVIAVLNTAISAFYYLGVVRQMYVGDATSEAEIRPSLPMQAMLLAAAAGVFVFFIYPYPLIEAAQRAVQGFA